MAYCGCDGGVGALNGSERNAAGEVFTADGENPRPPSGRLKSGPSHGEGDGWGGLKLIELLRPACDGRVGVAGGIAG